MLSPGSTESIDQMLFFSVSWEKSKSHKIQILDCSPSSLSQAHPPPLTLNTFTHHTIQFPGASAAFYRFTIHPNRYHEATQRVVDIKLFECYMLRACFLWKNFLITSMYKAHYPKAKKNISEGKLSSFLQTFGWYTNNIQGHLPRIIQIDFLTLAQHSPTFTPIAVTQKPHKVTHYPGGPHRIIQLTLCSGRAWHTADRHGSRSLYTNTLNSFKTNTPPKNVIEFTSSNSTHSTLYISFIPFTTGVHRRTHSARIRWASGRQPAQRTYHIFREEQFAVFAVGAKVFDHHFGPILWAFALGLVSHHLQRDR